MSDEHKFFTVVFKGDISALDFNPLNCWTPFGEPVAARDGDAIKEDDTAEQFFDNERDVDH